MTREWKAGDVAMAVVTTRGPEPRRVVRTTDAHYPWRVDDEIGGHVRASVVREPRHYPLVVIDPEDRDQVERLTRLLFEVAHPFEGRIADTAAALREFANPTPPKPAEPQGLGAVVVDAEGRRYVRCDDDDTARWHCADDDTGIYDDLYRDIKAVEVLSAGVTP